MVVGVKERGYVMGTKSTSKKRSLFEWKRVRFSILLGLGLGLVYAVAFDGGLTQATANQAGAMAGPMVDIGALMTKALDLLEPGSAQRSPLQEVEDSLDPTVFLDASMELLSEMAREKGGAATVELDSGDQLEFTILPELQAEVEKLYNNYQPEEAAFVALDPRTGEILALTGYAGGRVSQHRALKAEGPAASVFKIVTAAALLEEHGVRPAKEMCYHGGGSHVSRSLLTPDPEHDNQCNTFAQAIGKSANVIFARLAYDKLTRNELLDYSERFAFNTVIPFVWPVELSKVDVPENRVEFARMAAGFRHASLSALHGALLVGSLANGGAMMRPQVLKRVVSDQGDVLYESQPEKLMNTVDKSTAETLSDMLLTTTREGTARKYFAKRIPAMKNIKVAGKTGSLSHQRGKDRFYYSWFVGFAPADNPQIAFASLVVNGPKWKVKGPYIAKKALDNFFSSRQRIALNKKH